MAKINKMIKGHIATVAKHLSIFFAWCFAIGTLQAQESAPLNFIVIVADDVGYGDLACYGNEHIDTPNLDKMAKEGMQCTDFYASSAMCSPSRAGMLSGLTHNKVNVFDWIAPDSLHYLPKETPTIASQLKQLGYNNGLFGKWHLNGAMGSQEQSQPDDFGFDHYFATQYSAHHLSPRGFWQNGKELGQQHGWSCQIVASRSINWMKKQVKQEKPFFSFVSFHEAHEPVISPNDLVLKYAEHGPKSTYYANIENMDRAIGRILQAVEEMGIKDNTVVLFTSDNGPASWGRGYFERSYGVTGGLKGRKRYLWEGGIRVPGIFWGAEVIPQGVKTGEAISNLDLLPTVCALSKAPLAHKDNLDGTDISPLFNNEELDREKALQWHFYAPVKGPNSVIRRGDYVLIAKWDGGSYTKGRFRNSYKAAIRDSELSDYELYNIKTDPGQTTDIKDAEKRRFKQMKKELIALHEEMKTSIK